MSRSVAMMMMTMMMIDQKIEDERSIKRWMTTIGMRMMIK